MLRLGAGGATPPAGPQVCLEGCLPAGAFPMDYDLCLAWNWEYDAAFVALLEEAGREEGLSLLQVTPQTLEPVLEALRQGRLTFRVLLDRASDSDGRFLALAAWARGHGSDCLNCHEHARRAWDKAAMHRLLERVVPTLPTLILPPYAEAPALPDLDLAALGPSFSVKPAHGGGGEGVLIGATTPEEIQTARQQQPEDGYLLQSHLDPVHLAGRPAWFRALFACGEVYLCWWDPQTHLYEALGPAEEESLGLSPLRRIVLAVAGQCHLDLFSSEIALGRDGQFVLVDYVNDPLDLRLQSQAAEGVPDAIVRSIVHRLVERVRRGRAGPPGSLRKGAGCSIMRAGPAETCRELFGRLRGALQKRGRKTGLSEPEPTDVEQGVTMEELPRDGAAQAEPAETGEAATAGPRLMLRRWCKRVVELGRTLWGRLPRRPRRPPPMAPSEEEIARWVVLLGLPDDLAHARALDELVVAGKPAVPALIEALYSETWIQAFRAAEALGLIGDRRAVRHLKRLLGHPNSNVRWGAAEALGRIRSRWAHGRLKRLAQQDEGRTSWGETVAEAAERAVSTIEQTWVSRVVNILWVLFYLALCAVVVLIAIGFVREAYTQFVRSMATPTPTLVTPQPTETPTPTPTPTPLPEFVPISGTILSDGANVRDQPNGTLIGVLNYGDEVLVYGGRMEEDGTWWYLIRLDKIHNARTSSEGPLAEGAYGWVWSVRVGGVAAPEIGPTVAAIETMRAEVATPTPISSSLTLPTPTPSLTATLAPTPTVSP